MASSTCNSNSCGTTAPAVDRSKIADSVKKASSSFYWAMRILPKGQREAIFAVYAFCRAVDDIADGPIERDVKRIALSAWRDEISALYQGNPKFSVVQALKEPSQEFGLRRQDFIDVIDGMQTDADGPVVAPSREELDLYCDRVASSVGRLCVNIFGEPGKLGIKVAHYQGRALQMTNILRDVAEDASDGRLYLPKEALEKHGLDASDPQTVMTQPGFAAMWRELADETEKSYEETYKALSECNRRKMRASWIMADVYHLQLKRMMELSDAQIADPDFNKRLVSKWEKIAIALKSVWV